MPVFYSSEVQYLVTETMTIEPTTYARKLPDAQIFLRHISSKHVRGQLGLACWSLCVGDVQDAHQTYMFKIVHLELTLDG